MNRRRWLDRLLDLKVPSPAEVGWGLMWLVIFAGIAAFITWAALSGWVDGDWDPFPGVDMLPG